MHCARLIHRSAVSNGSRVMIVLLGMKGSSPEFESFRHGEREQIKLHRRHGRIHGNKFADQFIVCGDAQLEVTFDGVGAMN